MAALETMSESDEATSAGSDHDTSGSVTRRVTARRLLLAVITLLLAAIAWGALYGALRQATLAQTAGQRVETVVQAMCGCLSVLTALTCYWQRPWANKVRVAWAASLVVGAGLSGLVWGPAMPLVALVMAGGTLLVALLLLWAMRLVGNLRGGGVRQILVR